MSVEDDPLETISTVYPHRDPIESDFDAGEILYNFLDQKDVGYKPIQNLGDGYDTIMAWNDPDWGEIGLKAYFTYCSGDDFDAYQLTENILNDNFQQEISSIIPREPSDRVIDTESVKIKVGEHIGVGMTEAEQRLPVNSAHCITFVDTPAIEKKDVEQKIDDEGMLSAALSAIEEPSFGTAMIFSGILDGDDVSAASVDYWTRSYDGIEPEGVDYSSIEW